MSDFFRDPKERDSFDFSPISASKKLEYLSSSEDPVYEIHDEFSELSTSQTLELQLLMHEQSIEFEVILDLKHQFSDILHDVAFSMGM